MAGAEHRGASSGDRRGRAPQHGGGRQRKPERIPCELVRPVFFVGFMGAGKTSVSRRLARLCGIASMWLAVFADTGVAMLCVLNSIRMLYMKTE